MQTDRRPEPAADVEHGLGRERGEGGGHDCGQPGDGANEWSFDGQRHGGAAGWVDGHRRADDQEQRQADECPAADRPGDRRNHRAQFTDRLADGDVAPLNHRAGGDGDGQEGGTRAGGRRQPGDKKEDQIDGQQRHDEGAKQEEASAHGAQRISKGGAKTIGGSGAEERHRWAPP